MIEHEGQLRRHGRGGDGRPKLRAGRDHVIDEPGVGHRGQPVQHGRPGQPVGVGLGQHRMADSHQPVAPGKLPERGYGIRHARRFEVYPADHAGDQVAGRCEREQFGVSSGLVIVCTTTVDVTPWAAASGSRSASRKFLRNGSSPGWSRNG